MRARLFSVSAKENIEKGKVLLEEKAYAVTIPEEAFDEIAGILHFEGVKKLSWV